MSLTVLEKINIGKLSEGYAIQDIVKGGLYGSGIDLQLPRKLYCITKNVEWLYDLIEAGVTLETPVLAAEVISSSEITLTWNDVDNATSYTLQRASDASFITGLTTVYTGALFTFADTGLSSSSTYYYRLQATATGYNDSNYDVTSAITD